MVRFSVNPHPQQRSTAEPFAAQLALSRVHPRLIALERTPGGYAIARDQTRGWFELHGKRGFAGYGLSRALRMLLDALSGLSALEDTTEKGQPFVHGELVPAMLRVDEAGVTRLIPLASWHWSGRAALPAAERCGHLAPERLLGDEIDPRADVFSAGVLLWEALAGRRLFETDSADSIVTRLMGGKINLPDLPPELSWAMPLKAVAMCALSVDPEQRFASCAELAQAIEAVAGAQIATHANVADFFRSPAPAPRASLIARPPSLPTHHSSLSALVAPPRSSRQIAVTASEPIRRAPTPPPKSRIKRSVWAIAVTSCMLTAFGLSAAARYSALQHARQSAASNAPIQGTPLSSLGLAGSVPMAPSAAPVPAQAASTGELPVLTEDHDQATKPRKPSTGVKGSPAKGTSAKPRVPAKSVRSFDSAGVKYGI